MTERIGLSPRPTIEQKNVLLMIHLLMTRQISGLADCIRHISYRNQWDGYVDHAKTELSDMYVLILNL